MSLFHLRSCRIPKVSKINYYFYGMKSAIKKIVSYVFRGWDDESGYSHAGLRLLPPFLYDVLAFLVALVILYHLVVFLKNLL